MNIIYQVGIYPPPFGGVSIHIKRLSEYLDSNNIKNYILVSKNNYSKNNIKLIAKTLISLLKLLFYSKNDIYHARGYNIKDLIFIFLMKLKKNKTIISFHGELFLEIIKNKGIILSKLYFFLLTFIDVIIVNTDTNKKKLSRVMKNKKIVCIPEFIPPLEIPPLPDKILQIIKNKKLVLSSNAFRISFHNNEDLYGIDLLIDLTSLLKNDGYDFVFIFLLPDIGDHEYFKKLNTKISQLELNEHFIFITEPLEEAASLWKHSDIVFRATNTDGNSLTILEALSLNKIVIASDCVERPENTILFKTRDLNSLYQTSKNIINNIENYKNRKYEYDSYQNAKKFLDLYLSIFGEVK